MEQQQVWLPPIVRGELDKVRKRVLNHDRDFVVVIDGEEGVGKSVLAMQWGAYLDPDFNLDKVVFNSNDFLKVIKDPNIKKGSCIILDEAYNAANSRASLTDVNRAMIGVATEMRQRNLFIIMVLPTFFDLDKYFALWRCRALVHVYFGKNDDRQYILFPKEQKKMLYLLGKKTYNYSKPRSPYPPFTFSNTYMVDETDYRQKKMEAFSKRIVSSTAKIWMLQRNAYIKYILRTTKLTQGQIAKLPENYGARPISQQAIALVVREFMDISS